MLTNKQILLELKHQTAPISFSERQCPFEFIPQEIESGEQSNN